MLRLELRGITKRFGDLVANDHIDLVVEPGEIHALLGENGAGKSTLMNILYGLLHPDEGEIVVDGRPRRFKGPGDAIAAGIGMVHQHFMLVPVFTVTENVMLGAETTRVAGLPRPGQRAGEGTEPCRSATGCRSTRTRPCRDLPVGVQQRVEIIKALVREVDLLILDEPTAVLTPQETDELLEVMRALKAGGKSIVFITHKLREVKAIADRITVVRRGRVVDTAQPDASEDELAVADGRAYGEAQGRQGAGPAGRAGAGRTRAGRGRRAWPPRGGRRRPGRYGPARCSASPASRATARPSWSRRSWACVRWRTGEVDLSGVNLAGRSTREVLRRRGRRTSPRTAAWTG